MSDNNGPVRRRRIAGESSPATPAAPAKKAPAKKAAAKKAPAAAPAKKAPGKKTAATKSADTAAAVTTPAAPVVRKAPISRPAPQVPTRKPVVASPAKAAKASKAPKPPKAAREAGTGPSRRDLLWLVPSALVAIAALVLGALLVVNPPGQGDSSSALDSSGRQASSSAASAAETIFSFRYDQLDEHLKASKALMTPGFGKQFDKIAPALTELAPQRKIVVQAVARDAAALPCGDECSASKADVLVFVDQARLVGDSKEPTVFANRIKVSMVKADDVWLVSNIRAL